MTTSARAYEKFRGLRPQEWDEVTAPPQAIADGTRALLPDHDGDLTLEELGALVSAIAARPDLWEPMTIVDPNRRRYRLMYEDHRIDIWTLSWMDGQGTGFHDHDVSGVGLVAARGMIVERQMLLPQGASRLEMRPGGDVRMGGAGYIHSVAWGEGEPAVSIHAYSPSLLHVGQYRVNEQGILARHIEHGRQELMDFSIADIDPTRADFS
jgi:predicted metal-dependent enzyme (double-stranded beta helix superfamily)